MSVVDLGKVNSRKVHGQAVRQFVAFGYVVTGPERGGVTYLRRGGKYIAYNFRMTSLCELGALQAAVGVKVVPLALWLQC
jgi:hypothetical protein